jgi:hypothetical protein
MASCLPGLLFGNPSNATRIRPTQPPLQILQILAFKYYQLN